MVLLETLFISKDFAQKTSLLKYNYDNEPVRGQKIMIFLYNPPKNI